MKLIVAAVGRNRAAPEQALFDDYAKRLAGRGPAGMILELREVEERRKLPDAARKQSEAALLAAQIPAGSLVVALDGRGKTLASQELAKRLANWRDQGRAEIVFLIGGADGLGQELLARADFTLSLSAMTWPHMLVRAMLAEQLYRAQSILLGHPYHR